MKKILFATKQLAVYLLTASILLTACKKDKDGTPGYKSGDLTFKSVFPEEGGGGTMVTISGNGFGDIRTIVFDKGDVPATFNPTLNSTGNIIFRVPNEVNGGPQNIILTNGAGKTLSVPFNALAFPVVNTTSLYDFVAGTEITLTGNNLDDVTKVVLKGTTAEAEILSQDKTSITIKMPTTTVIKAPLDLTNVTGTVTTTFVYAYRPLNFVVFDDVLGQGTHGMGQIQSWSWGLNGMGPDTEFKKEGTAALKVDYTGGGGLSLFLGTNWAGEVFSDLYPPAFISFWVRAKGEDANIIIRPDNPWPSAGPGSGEHTFTAFKDVWTYYRIPNFITGGFGRLNLQLQGSTDRTIYFDNFLIIK